MSTRLGLSRASATARHFHRRLATHAPLAEKDCTSITPPYSLLQSKLDLVRAVLKRPLTLAEKILYSHLHNPEKTLANGGITRGESYLLLSPERVAMQDASAQCAFAVIIRCDMRLMRIFCTGWLCEYAVLYHQRQALTTQTPGCNS